MNNTTSLSRRHALKFLGASSLFPVLKAQAASLPQTPNLQQPLAKDFEIAASLYPWDLADEGVVQVLDNLQEKSACNSVYLIAMMHNEKRPKGELYFPHNPNRRFYIPEHGCAYWKPNNKYYNRIKPSVIVRDEFIKGVDWVQRLIEEARKRKMKVGVELSHTLMPDERAANEVADCIQRNARLDRIGNFLCINNADVREYVTGMYNDLLNNYDLDFIQTCQILFDGGRKQAHPAMRIFDAAKGSCFCDACQKEASKQGIDLVQIRQKMLPLINFAERPTRRDLITKELLEDSNTTATAILLEHPELFTWLQFKQKSVVDYFKLLHQTIKRNPRNVEFRYNAHRREDQEFFGDDIKNISSYVDSFRASHYGEESGKVEDVEEKRKYLMALRYAMGEEKPLISAISIRKNTTDELLKMTIQMAQKCGIDGISLGHYDSGTFANMVAIRAALQSANINFNEVWKKK